MSGTIPNVSAEKKPKTRTSESVPFLGRLWVMPDQRWAECVSRDVGGRDAKDITSTFANPGRSGSDCGLAHPPSSNREEKATVTVHVPISALTTCSQMGAVRPCA